MKKEGKVTVSIIGTCRVHDTLRQVEKRGLIQINNGDISTFVHSLPEIFMRLRVLNRVENIQQTLWIYKSICAVELKRNPIKDLRLIIPKSLSLKYLL